MSKLFIGGQAVVEGVMMRTKTHYAVAVRKPDGTISTKVEKIKQLPKLLQLPFIRGTVVLWDTLVLGTKALVWSANESSPDEDGKLEKKEVITTFAVAGILAVGLFVLLPLAVAHYTASQNTILFNVVDGIMRTLLFVLYLAGISFLPDVQRMFQYHGAEHMSVHAHERGVKLVPKEIRKFKTMHPRCGTSFLLTVLIVSIIVFTVVSHPNFFVKFVSRLALLPVVAGISYEFLRLSAKVADTLFGKILAYPGIALQYITTKQPDDKQIEVAVAALKAVIRQG